MRDAAGNLPRPYLRHPAPPPAKRFRGHNAGLFAAAVVLALLSSDSPSAPPAKDSSPPRADLNRAAWATEYQPRDTNSETASIGDHQCRLWAVIGGASCDSLLNDQLVTGTHSLMLLGEANPDGWGLTYFSPVLQSVGWEGPAIVRGGPAANNAYDQRFISAVAKMLTLDPTCALAHIRRSSGTHTGVPDPHPFWRDGLALAHNGLISATDLTTLLESDDPDFLDTHPADYRSPYIDSELLLLYLLKLRQSGVEPGVLPRSDELGGRASSEQSRSRALPDVINRAIFNLHDDGAIQTAANIAVTNGDTLIGVRFDSGDTENYKLRYRELPDGWVLASEPLGSDTTGWSEFPPKSLGIFTRTAPPQFVTIFPPPDPYLVIDSVIVDDDQIGDSYGNGDGDCDAAERIELIITLHNQGYEPATNVRATLTTTDTLCQILDAEEIYGDIAVDSTLACQEDFDIYINASCPDEHVVPLTLNIECDGPRVWQRTYDLTINAPRIDVDHYVIDDLTTGNGNGRIEPGESFRLSTALVNRGADVATNLQIALEIINPHATIDQGLAQLDTLPSGGIAFPSPPFEVAVGSDCPAWDVLYGHLSIQGDGQLDTATDFMMPVGGFYDDIESGSGNWATYLVHSGYTNQWHRSDARNYTSGGSWSWKFGGSGTNHYSNLAAGALESEAVPLHAYSYLRFRYWAEAETSVTYPGYCYDGGMVELMAGDSAWQQIFPVGGYPYQIRNVDGTSPLLPHTGVYSGSVDWKEALFEITGYSGDGKFRFVFGSDDGNTREGWYIDNVEFFGADTLWPADAGGGMPLILHPSLGQSRPNPGTPGMRIQFAVPKTGPVGIEIYDITGRLVRTLVSGSLPAGRHDIQWDGLDRGGREAAAGTYLYRFSCDGFTTTRRLVLLR